MIIKNQGSSILTVNTIRYFDIPGWEGPVSIIHDYDSHAMEWKTGAP